MLIDQYLAQIHNVSVFLQSVPQTLSDNNLYFISFSLQHHDIIDHAVEDH